MKSIERMREWLQWLVREFPMLQCRYRYDGFSRMHWIEVSPSFIFDADAAYKNAEFRITSAFSEEFPSELACFIAPGDVITVDEPTEKFYGKLSHLLTAPTLTWHEELVPLWHEAMLPSYYPLPVPRSNPLQYWGGIWTSPLNVNPIGAPVVIVGQTHSFLDVSISIEADDLGAEFGIGKEEYSLAA